ncbi:hypothetical protein V8C35DRAFT_328188 [Trichoderma chlorosporum]
MKPLSYFTLLLAASGVNGAVTNVPRNGVKCSGISRGFTSGDITNAGNGALDHRNNPIGDRRYPHVYHFNRPDCGGELWGFPLLNTITYEGGSPGLVRAIFTFVNQGGTTVARYCGTYAHKTRPGDNDFYLCT